MRQAASALFLVIGFALLWSALAKATLNPVSWILYWVRARRRLIVLGVVVVLLVAAASLYGSASDGGSSSLPDTGGAR